MGAVAAVAEDSVLFLGLKKRVGGRLVYETWAVSQLGVSVRGHKLNGQLWRYDQKEWHYAQSIKTGIYVGKTRFADSADREISYWGREHLSVMPEPRITGSTPYSLVQTLNQKAEPRSLSQIIRERDVRAAADRKFEQPWQNFSAVFMRPPSSAMQEILAVDQDRQPQVLQSRSDNEQKIWDQYRSSAKSRHSRLSEAAFFVKEELAVILDNEGMHIYRFKNGRIGQRLKHVRQAKGILVCSSTASGKDAWDLDRDSRRLKPIDP
jgi:hypothetical protein